LESIGASRSMGIVVALGRGAQHTNQHRIFEITDAGLSRANGRSFDA
jgi:hypothetical protein